jgi:hypothetical protein
LSLLWNQLKLKNSLKTFYTNLRLKWKSKVFLLCPLATLCSRTLNVATRWLKIKTILMMLIIVLCSHKTTHAKYVTEIFSSDLFTKVSHLICSYEYDVHILYCKKCLVLENTLDNIDRLIQIFFIRNLHKDWGNLLDENNGKICYLKQSKEKLQLFWGKERKLLQALHIGFKYCFEDCIVVRIRRTAIRKVSFMGWIHRFRMVNRIYYSMLLIFLLWI